MTFQLPGASDHFPPDLPLEPTAMAIGVDLDHARRGATIDLRIEAVGRRSDRATLDLDAIDLLDLEVIDESGEGAGTLRHGYDGRILKLAWSEPVTRGAQRVVRLRYRVLPRAGLYFSAPDADHPERPAFAATDHESSRARHWLACVDHPAVRTTLRWTITSEAGHRIAASGMQEGEDVVEGGRRTARFVLEQPCPSYLACFVAGDLLEVRARNSQVPMRWLAAHSHGAEAVGAAFGTTDAMMTWMQGRLGVPFPFPRYDQFAVPGIGGAMENICLTSWDDLWLPSEARTADIGAIFQRINLHELAHTWFGDLVVIADFAHAWLKESWATWMEVVWLSETVGEDDGRHQLWLNAERYFQECATYRRPIVTRRYHEPWDMFDRHLYPGGAWRLQMLRHQLGEEDFWAGVKDYLEAHSFGVAETPEFRRCMEKASGRNLVRFFEQWIHAPGFPDLEVGFSWDPEKGFGTFDIKQTQVDEDAGVGLFDFELELGVQLTEGAPLELHRVTVGRAQTTLRIPLAAEPRQVRVDPRGRVLARVKLSAGLPRWRHTLVEATDVVGRIEAGRALIKDGSAASLAAVEAAWPTEAFWGVRSAWAEALGSARHPGVDRLLASLLGIEQEARVLAALGHAARAHRGGAIARALRARLSTALSPGARSALLWALGACREEGDEALLLAQLADTSERATMAGGALLGLAARRDGQWLPALLEASATSAPDDLRPAGARGLGLLASWLIGAERKRAVERLLELVDDAQLPVAWTAARALPALGPGVPGAAAALRRFQARLPQQYRARVQAIIAQLPAADATPWKKELEELRGQLKDALGRLAQLEG